LTECDPSLKNPGYAPVTLGIYHHTCPWPREIALSFFENLISSANLYRSAAGSVPTDNTKISGVLGEESLNTRDKSAV